LNDNITRGKIRYEFWALLSNHNDISKVTVTDKTKTSDIEEGRVRLGVNGIYKRYNPFNFDFLIGGK
jgi:hypothetical protein